MCLKSEKSRILLFFTLLFLLYTFAPRYVGMGHSARYALVRAIVEDRSFSIDKYVQTTIDWSKYGGHYYANKAPGISMLAAPVYWCLLKIERIFNIDNSDWWYRNLRWTDVVVTAVPSVLLAYLMFVFLRRRTDEKKALLITFTYATGTIAFVFSTMLWAHQTAAFFLFGSFYFLIDKRSALLSGLFMGLAVLTEYTCAVALPGLFFIFFKRPDMKPIKRLKAFIHLGMGALPGLLLFMWYHKASFGGYFTPAVTYTNSNFQTQGNAFGVLGIPHIIPIIKLLIGIHKGLFLVSPVLVLSIVGFYNWIKRTEDRLIASAFLSVIAGFLLLNSSFNNWHAGCSSGPRYLTSMVPMLAVFLAFVRQTKFVSVLAVISIINTCAIVAVNTAVCTEIRLLDEGIYPYLFNDSQRWKQFLMILLTVSLMYIVLKWKIKETR